MLMLRSFLIENLIALSVTSVLALVPALADTFSAKVIKVTDGDTIADFTMATRKKFA